MSKNPNLLESFKNAFNGLYLLMKHERNAWVHLVFTGLAVALGIYLQLGLNDWILILLAIFLVWITELCNTAFEYLFDFVEPQRNPFVKIGKDMAAAAVLLSSIFSVIVGILILGPALLIKLGLIPVK